MGKARFPRKTMVSLPEQGGFLLQPENQATHWSISKAINSKPKAQAQSSRLVVYPELVWIELGSRLFGLCWAQSFSRSSLLGASFSSRPLQHVCHCLCREDFLFSVPPVITAAAAPLFECPCFKAIPASVHDLNFVRFH